MNLEDIIVLSEVLGEPVSYKSASCLSCGSSRATLLSVLY